MSRQNRVVCSRSGGVENLESAIGSGSAGVGVGIGVDVGSAVMTG